MPKNIRREKSESIFVAVFTFFLCVAAALLLYQSKIFSREFKAYSLFIYPLIGCIAFAIQKMYSIKVSIIVAVFVFVIQEIIGRSLPDLSMLSRLCLAMTIVLAVYLFNQNYQSALSRISFGKFAYFLGMFLTLYISVLVIISLLTFPDKVFHFIQSSIFNMTVIGLFMGLGLELGMLISKKIFK